MLSQIEILNQNFTKHSPIELKRANPSSFDGRVQDFVQNRM